MNPARPPFDELPGLDAAWSRLVRVPDPEHGALTWHVLDSHAAAADTAVAGTLLCVHGNPTWSYLWRGLVAAPPAGWRVVAVDQLAMGYSERPPGTRPLATRVADLGRLTAAMRITGPGSNGPVVTVAHDWGGPISLGWARDHRDQLAGMVLTNTAVHQPAGSPAPALIRLARAPGARQLICELTPAFVATTARLSRPALPPVVRAALAAPYRSRARRRAIADFVADIPLDDAHPSARALAGIVAALPELQVPTLLLWGPRDPVFSDRYLRDLMQRFPHADVHRFEGASHLLLEDAPDATVAITRWIDQQQLSGRDDAGRERVAGERVAGESLLGGARSPRTLWAHLDGCDDDHRTAFVEMGGARIDFAGLARRVADVEQALRSRGVQRGQRVALLVPPGIDLAAVVYACWRIGAVIVVADAGLGLRRLGRALRGSGGEWVIGSQRGLLAARALRVPGRRIDVADLRVSDGHGCGLVPPEPEVDGADVCAVVFTSGATGPPKGVVYRHQQVLRQLGVLSEIYDLTRSDRMVAAFAPFALYGPALGIGSTIPAMDVTAPSTLTATALADAVASVDATVVFASPAALINVVATAAALDAAQRAALRTPRLVLSAGAPLPIELLQQVSRLFSGASVHAPYGMTEMLPVTDISLEQIEAAGPGRGVCVGEAVTGVRLMIRALGGSEPAPVGPGVTGEIWVSAEHGKQTYDRLWLTEARATPARGWHNTGDVGHLDDQGRLWVEGRTVDVISTADGPVTPVPGEQLIQRQPSIKAAALVGVGPPHRQSLVAVVVPAEARHTTATGRRLGSLRATLRRAPSVRVADLATSDLVRHSARLPIAAVLATAALPVDIRHNSKIDHQSLRVAAARLLGGHRGRLARRRAS